jgi:hypothetical protein
VLSVVLSLVLSDLSPDLVEDVSALSLLLPSALVGAAGAPPLDSDAEFVLSLALLCEEGSLEEVLFRFDEEEEEEEDDDESLRRGAGSWVEDGALLLMAWVLLSTNAPKESLGVVLWVLCERAGFACALDTCALAATSDVLPTTGDPLKTSSGQEVSKERANLAICQFLL